MDRRGFLRGAGAVAAVAGLEGCKKVVTTPVSAASLAPTAQLPVYDKLGPLVPIRAEIDRIFKITVCTRPFRPAGPRLDGEKIGEKFVVHNYGHGGSGWSLSWGSADVVVKKVLEEGNHRGQVAVIGCGALGMTAALTAQRYGLKTTIYTKERPPFVRSMRATGTWTPDSRVSFASVAGPAFGDLWERMARTSLTMHQSFVGTPGEPVEWMDQFSLSDGAGPQGGGRVDVPGHDWGRYANRIADLMPHTFEMPPGTHPFPVKIVRRTTSMTFNVHDYARQLMNDFQVAGGRIETREFHAPQDLATLPEHTIIHSTGYAARQWWGDNSLVPVRGQIAWLIPQEDVHYGIFYNGVAVVARRDGIVVQPGGGGEEFGWNDDTEVPDRAAAEAGVLELQKLYRRMTTMNS